MKVKFKHQLTIKYSRVIEALSLVCVLGSDSYHSEVLDLEAFTDLSEKYTDFFNRLRPYPHMRFAWLEFALLSFERDDLKRFIHDIEEKTLAQCLTTLLGHEVLEEDAVLALTSKEEAVAITRSLGYDDDFSGFISDLSVILKAFYEVVLAIDAHPGFEAALNEVTENGTYEIWLHRFNEGLENRHPLSYAQELMGKPFWNIADYSRYEFIPVHLISPYSMRLMDGDTMIYIHGLKKRDLKPEERLEQILEPLKSVADGTRLKILQMLYMHPMYGKEIAEALNLTTATVSHHLEALNQQGLVNVEKVKQIKYFSTNYTRLSRKLDEVTKFIKEK